MHPRVSALRRAAVVGAVLLSVAPLVACGGDSDPDLVVFSSRPATMMEPLIVRFEESTGLDVDVEYAESADIADRLIEEGADTSADVFLSEDSGALSRVSEAGLAGALPRSVLSRVPERFRAEDGTWAGVSGHVRAFVVDQVLAEGDRPATVRELTEEKWRGRVGIVPTNTSFQAFVTAMRALEGEEAARQWLADLVANDVHLFPGDHVLVKTVGTGGVQVGLVDHQRWFSADAQTGGALPSDLVWAAPGDVGGVTNVSGVAVLEGSADRRPARRFAHWIVSPAVLDHFAKINMEVPLDAYVVPAPGVPALADLQGPEFDLDVLGGDAQTRDLLADVGLLPPA